MQTEGGYAMRNNSTLGSCDQAVRQAGGLVLEPWGCDDRQGKEGGGGKVQGC